MTDDAQQPTNDQPTGKAEDANANAEVTAAGTDQYGRQLYSVKCANCGKDTQVPFKPAGNRPVYCRDCYMQRRKDRGGSGGGYNRR